MRLATFKADGGTSYGAVVGDGIIDLGRRLTRYPSLLDLFRAGTLSEAKASAKGEADYKLGQVELLPPIPAPEKFLCVGINYPDRNAEYKDNRQASKYPNLFVRFPGSFVGHGQPLVRPRVSEKFDYEAEVVMVIGRQGRHVPTEQALGFIGGLTLSNEGTVRDWVRHGSLNITQGKNFDASGSIGPWIVTSDELDPRTPLHLTSRVNGELRQDDTTANLIFPFARLIEYLSSFMRLTPGDLIATGTPTGAGARFDPPKYLRGGDTIEVQVAEIGTLRNVVVDETPS